MESEKRIFYGWIVVGIAFLIMSVTYAIWCALNAMKDAEAVSGF